MQQSLPEEYEHQLNKEKEENVAILSHLSRCEQVPHQEIPLRGSRKNASELVALQNLNEELLSAAKEQHQQLGAVCFLAALSQKVRLRSKKG